MNSNPPIIKADTKKAGQDLKLLNSSNNAAGIMKGVCYPKRHSFRKRPVKLIEKIKRIINICLR